MEEQKLKLDDKVIYMNKNGVKRKQYNFSIQTNIIEEIIKIQQALQLFLDTPVLRGEIIENVLIKGLHASGEAIIIDNEGYTFSDLLDIHKWLEDDLIRNFKEQLSTLKSIKKIEEEAKILYIPDKSIGNYEKEFDITNLDDEELITSFIDALWDQYLLNGNKYYRIRNLKFIESITILPEIIKTVLYLYNEIENMKNNFSNIRNKIKDCKDDFEFYELIIKMAINYVSEEKKFNKYMFEEENWIKSGYINDCLIYYTQTYGTDLSKASKNEFQN